MKKEYYRHILPHFQQPGQAYFVTWNLKDAVPPKAFIRYTQELEMLKSQIEFHKKQNSENSVISHLLQEYILTREKYLKAYNDLLDANRNPTVNLSKPANTEILINTLQYWEGKKLKNQAFTIMPNHVHWVLELLEKDEEENSVFLQDVLQSVKRFSANRINKAENRQGNLWQKESFETTIRDDRHFINAIRYTLNNPVVEGLVEDWKKWPGTWCEVGCGDF
jgi:putative transposase